MTPMPQLLAAAAALLALGAAAAKAQALPDLGGRTIVAVTENAYIPLNFADPKTGEGVGFEYDLSTRSASASTPRSSGTCRAGT